MPRIQSYSTLDDAIALAEFAHRNQRDQAGEPYIRHPMRVLRALQEQGARSYVQIAGVLHDVTEDTRYTPGMLLDLGVLPAAVDIIKLVDRHYSKYQWAHDSANMYHAHGLEMELTADEYYYFHIRNNPGALQLKLCDIGDNLLPWRVVYLPPQKQKHLKEKYETAIKLLTE